MPAGSQSPHWTRILRVVVSKLDLQNYGEIRNYSGTRRVGAI
jgi:hypothetical protein